MKLLTTKEENEVSVNLIDSTEVPIEATSAELAAMEVCPVFHEEAFIKLVNNDYGSLIVRCYVSRMDDKTVINGALCIQFPQCANDEDYLTAGRDIANITGLTFEDSGPYELGFWEFKDE